MIKFYKTIIIPMVSFFFSYFPFIYAIDRGTNRIIASLSIFVCIKQNNFKKVTF